MLVTQTREWQTTFASPWICRVSLILLHSLSFHFTNTETHLYLDFQLQRNTTVDNCISNSQCEFIVLFRKTNFHLQIIKTKHISRRILIQCLTSVSIRLNIWKYSMLLFDNNATKQHSLLMMLIVETSEMLNNHFIALIRSRSAENYVNG